MGEIGWSGQTMGGGIKPQSADSKIPLLDSDILPVRNGREPVEGDTGFQPVRRVASITNDANRSRVEGEKRCGAKKIVFWEGGAQAGSTVSRWAHASSTDRPFYREGIRRSETKTLPHSTRLHSAHGGQSGTAWPAADACIPAGPELAKSSRSEPWKFVCRRRRDRSSVAHTR